MGKTKEEEIRAFNAIEDILDDFDPKETHVGKAFEGCVEQAEENIRNDRMLSWKGRYLEEQMKNCRLSDKVEALTKELNRKDDMIARLEDRYDRLFGKFNASNDRLADLSRQLNYKDDAIARLEDAKNQLVKELDEVKAAYTTRDFKLARANETADGLKQTILELKAKLYDLMTTGEEVEE